MKIKRILLSLVCVFMVFSAEAIGISDIKKYSVLKYKSIWLNEYYEDVKPMRSAIFIYQIDNPSATSDQIVKAFSKVTPDNNIIKELKLMDDGGNIIVTVVLKNPEGGFYKEDVLMGKCLITNVIVLKEYCR